MGLANTAGAKAFMCQFEIGKTESDHNGNKMRRDCEIVANGNGLQISTMYHNNQNCEQEIF